MIATLCFGQVASAQLIYTYSFSGSVTALFDTQGVLPGDINLNDSVTGTVTYFDSAPLSGSTLFPGRHTFDSTRQASLEVMSGSHVFGRSSADGFEDFITISSGDDFSVRLGDNSDDFVPWASDPNLLSRSLRIDLRDGDATVVPSNNLADVTGLDLSRFSGPNFGNTVVLLAAEPERLARFDWSIDTLTLESVTVPEPSSATIGIVVLGFALRRRKVAC